MIKTYTAEQFRNLIVKNVQDFVGPPVVEISNSNIEVINGWLARGDKAAVYENQDLGHRDLGFKAILSFGSPDAMIPPTCAEVRHVVTGNVVKTFLTVAAAESYVAHVGGHDSSRWYDIEHPVAGPPDQCPDIASNAVLSIAWRYQLIGTYSGEQLRPIEPTEVPAHA